jgi:sporulation protein YlmC with PRC-barrel domain
MIKAIVFAAALATAGAGAVYAQQSGTTGAERGAGGTMGTERGTTMDKGTTRDLGTTKDLGTTRDHGTTMGKLGTMGSVKMMTTLPQHATAISNWYDQNVYDTNDNKIGEVKDMLLDREGKVQAVIVSVGGFLGMGEKDVAVPFDAVGTTQRDNKWWLSMNATKDELRTAPGFRFDRSKQAWTVATR